MELAPELGLELELELELALELALELELELELPQRVVARVMTRQLALLGPTSATSHRQTLMECRRCPHLAQRLHKHQSGTRVAKAH